MAAVKGPGLYEFLTEAELQHYFNALKTELKVHNVGQLKFVTEEDLAELGMSRPEMRRLRKYFNKHCPQTYLSKMKKKLLQKKDSSCPLISMPEDEKGEGGNRPPSNRHIIPPDAIVINKELGVGEFGVVQQGIWTNEMGERIQVAIKCLSPDRLQSQPVEFLKEALIMHTINSEHIVRLYGVVLDSNSFMLVTELAPLRSLLECLKEPSLRCSFPVTSLCHFSVQICDGMTYLEENRLIHRDLAARNILVFSKNKVKISDFGLSRALRVGKDYYQTNFNVNLKLPIAWCAPECINYLKFTSASDVWAFGVTLWEMFSYGFQPWPALTGHQILEAIDEPNFQRLEQPDYCPREYYSVMLQCWQHNPASRPKFAQLLTTLPEYSPEQVQAVRGSGECPHNYSEREWLCYSIGDVLTVLDKKVPDQHPNQPCLWKGILNSGKTGFFVPANTITYLGPNVPSNKPFQRGDGKNAYSSKRKLRSDMISGPQGDLKHTGHVGLDGAYFGDVGFLADKISNVPQQVVNPYRPSEDQVVTSHDNPSSQDKRFESYSREPSRSSTSSKGSNDSFSQSSGQTISLSREVHTINKNSARFKNLSRACSDISDKVPLLTRSNEKSQQDWEGAAAATWWNTSMTNSSLTLTSNGERSVLVSEELPADHQYTEISDEDEAAVEQMKAPVQPKSAFDLGPSLMDEVFGALERSSNSIEQDNGVLQPSPLDADVNVKNEIRELTINSKLGKKKPGAVKAISSCDEKSLDSAIAMANELACKSMLALNDEKMPASPLNSPPSSPSSPSVNGAKGHNRFSFKFKNQSPKQQRRHFSEEVNSITDIQASITDQAKDAYNSLIGGTLKPTKSSGRATSKGTSSDSNPLRMLRAGLPVRPKVRGNKHNLPHQPQNNNRPASSAFRDSLSDSYGAFSTLPKGFKPGRPDSGLDPNTEEQLSNLSLDPSAVNGSTGCNNSSYHSMMSHNPLPLPPRDRTKAQSFSKPRHQRKHPLIMPLTSSLLRSSEKTEPPSRLVIEHTHNPHLDGGEDQTDSNDSSSLTIAIDGYSSNGHNPPAKPPRLFSPALDDSFDSQVACEMDALDGVANDTITLSKSENGETEESEPLLQSLMYSSGDHVSCEDLLEFALDKPDSRRTAGPQHGASSDEVKLIRKILKNQVSVGDCMDALDCCDWDVHHALKLSRLLLLLPQYQQKEGLSAEELADARDLLSSFAWDVTKTASHIASLS